MAEAEGGRRWSKRWRWGRAGRGRAAAAAAPRTSALAAAAASRPLLETLLEDRVGMELIYKNPLRDQSDLEKLFVEVG